MEINAYQPCPCHAERKIKFCCGKQIVGDLNAVMTLSGAGQTVAAIDKLDRLLQSWGEKDCLLTLRTHLLLEVGEIEKARRSNESFLEKNPKHPMGLLHRTLICLVERDVAGAVRASQDAMDAIKGTAIPIAFANAYRLLGIALLQRGEVFAGRAHLKFARTLRPNDQSTLMAIRESLRASRGNTLRKYDPWLPAAPPEPLWSRTYQQVGRLIDRGQWRTALQYLDRKMLPEHPQEPVLHRSIAILAMWLGDRERASTAWRAVAECPGASTQEAVEAFGWVMALSDRLSTRAVEQKRRIVEIRDAAEIKARLEADPLVGEITEFDEPMEEGETASRWLLLDRPALTEGKGVEFLQLPLVVADALLRVPPHGPPRWEMTWWDVPEAQAAATAWLERLGELLDSSTESTIVLRTLGEDSARLTWSWRLPDDVAPELSRKWECAMATHLACEVWPQIPMQLLDGLTPQEAVQKPQYLAPLLALISQFETNGRRHPFNADTARAVREHLGLPEPERIDPRQRDAKTIPPIWLTWVDWELAGDTDLLSVAHYAINADDRSLAVQLSEEIVRREHLHAQVDLAGIYKILAESTLDDEQAVEWVRRLRRLLVSRGQSPGLGLMLELELRLARGIAEKTQELFGEITARHLEEPEVAQRFARLMAHVGLPRGNHDDEGHLEEGDSGDAAVGAPSGSSAPGTESAQSPERTLWLPGDP